jgi:hypothetical protein
MMSNDFNYKTTERAFLSIHFSIGGDTLDAKGAPDDVLAAMALFMDALETEEDDCGCEGEDDEDPEHCPLHDCPRR